MMQYDTTRLQWVNSIFPSKYKHNFKCIIFKTILVIDSLTSCGQSIHRWISMDWWISIGSGNGLVPSGKSTFIINLDYGLSPIWCQAIINTLDELSSIKPYRMLCNRNSVKIWKFSVLKICFGVFCKRRVTLILVHRLSVFTKEKCFK